MNNRVAPFGVNLYGETGLPVMPFRTDDWPMPDK